MAALVSQVAMHGQWNPMRKILLGLAAIAAIAGTTLGVAGTASAAETTRHATFTAIQPAGGFSQFETVWTHTFAVDVDANGNFTGTGGVSGSDQNGSANFTEKVTGSFSADDSHVTLHVYDRSTGDGVVWDLTNAQVNTIGTDVVSIGYIVGNPNYLLEWKISVIAFTNATPTPIALGNHGDCVSGATHAGVKGTKLAAIAKVVTNVGAYGSDTCKAVV